MKAKSDKKRSRSKAPRGKTWLLKLYVAGQTPRSMNVISNIRRVCEELIPGKYQLDVIDVLKHRLLAQRDQIIAIPTLIRQCPEPKKIVIGDMTNTKRFISSLELPTSLAP